MIMMKYNHNEIFEEEKIWFDEIFDEIIRLTDEINSNDLIYHFKGATARKRFDDFNNGIKLLKNENLVI